MYVCLGEEYDFCAGSPCEILHPSERYISSQPFENAQMMTRRIPSPMLFVREAPARWLRMLACTIDSAAETTGLATAHVCRNHWQHGRMVALQPVVISHRASINSRRG